MANSIHGGPMADCYCHTLQIGLYIWSEGGPSPPGTMVYTKLCHVYRITVEVLFCVHKWSNQSLSRCGRCRADYCKHWWISLAHNRVLGAPKKLYKIMAEAYIYIYITYTVTQLLGVQKLASG